jgi:hypothetical protein
MIYAARYETMNGLLGYLTENCCRGRADQCIPTERVRTSVAAARRKEPVV